MGNLPNNCGPQFLCSSCKFPPQNEQLNTIRISGKEQNLETSVPKSCSQFLPPIHQIENNKLSKITILNTSSNGKNNTLNNITELPTHEINKNLINIPKVNSKNPFTSKNAKNTTDNNSSNAITSQNKFQDAKINNSNINTNNINNDHINGVKINHFQRQLSGIINNSTSNMSGFTSEIPELGQTYHSARDEKEYSLEKLLISLKKAYRNLPCNESINIPQNICEGIPNGIEETTQNIDINVPLNDKQLKLVKNILIKEEMIISQMDRKTIDLILSIVNYKLVSKNVILFNMDNSCDNIFYIVEKGKLRYEIDGKYFYLKKGDTIGTKALKKHSKESCELSVVKKSYLFCIRIDKYKTIIQDFITKEREHTIELLKENFIFNCIDKKNLYNLSSRIKKRHFNGRRVIIESGVMPTNIYLIVRGGVLCLQNDEVKHTLNPKELFGDVSFLSDSISEYTYISNPGTSLLVVPYTELLLVLGNKPIDNLVFSVFNSALDKCEYLKTNLCGDRLKPVFQCFKLNYIKEGLVSSFKMKKIFIAISGILIRKQLTKEEIYKEGKISKRKSQKCVTKNYTNIHDYGNGLFAKLKPDSNENDFNKEIKPLGTKMSQKLPVKLFSIINNYTQNAPTKVLPELEYHTKGELDIESITSVQEDKTSVISRGCVVLEAYWENILNNISPLLQDEEINTKNLCSISKRISLLKSIAKCKHFNDLKLFLLADLLKIEKFKENSIILKNGPISNKVYIICSGEVKLRMSNTSIDVRTLTEKMHFGEISQEFLEQNSQAATHFDFIANTQVECLTFDKDTYIDIRDKYNNPILGPFTNLFRIKDNSITLNNLFYLSDLGCGTYGKVYLVHNENQFFAVKTADIQALCGNTTALEFYLNEKRIMLNMNYHFIVNLVNTFKTSEFIFFLIEYIDGITLREYINNRMKNNSLRNHEEIQFYGSILFLVLNYLQKKRIIHRDLKPENIMIDTSGYLKVIDFGVAKDLSGKNSTNSLIGTPHYMAPEVILGKSYSFSSDYWSVGIILYELFYGQVPFGMDVSDTKQIFSEITEKKLVLPSDPKNEDVNKLIKHLLNKNPSKRTCSFIDIKEHELFKEINFESIYQKEIIPKYIPERKVSDDLLQNIKMRFYQSIISKLYLSGVELNLDFVQFSKTTIEDYRNDYVNDF